jgi:hypothetical protein
MNMKKRIHSLFGSKVEQSVNYAASDMSYSSNEYNIIKYKNTIKAYNTKLRKIFNPLGNAAVKEPKTTTTTTTTTNSRIMVLLVAMSSIAFLLLLLLPLVFYTISLHSVNAQQNTANTTTTTTTNKSNLVVSGKTFPIKYNITGGKLLGLIADNDRSTLVAVIGSPTDKGKLTIELPRKVIDSKAQGNVDTKYQIKIDGKGVEYKEMGSSLTERTLQIDFSKNDRVIEIIGTQLTS